MNYEGWVMTLFFISYVIVGTRLLTGMGYKPPVEPDPIEIEARRLAEIEINEWCDHWDELLGLTPVKPKVLVDAGVTVNPAPPTAREYWENQIVASISLPKEQMSVMPLVLTGKPDDIHTVTWTGDSFCLGCNKWTDKDECHVHVFNNAGEVVGHVPPLLDNRTRLA